MNRFLPLLLLLVCLAVLGAQPAPDSLYQVPVTAVADHDYAATLARLAPLAERGVRNADLYYDLGVCHYHLGDRGRAVLNFLRALNLNSAHRQARENLAWIHSTSPDLPQDPPRPYLAQLFLHLWDFFSRDRLAFAVLVLTLLTTLSLHLLFHYPPQRERGLPVLLVMVCALLLVGFASALGLKNQRWRHNARAVVLNPAELRSAPAAGRMLKELPPAAIVTVKKAQGQQLQVILPDGLSGWIDREVIEAVGPSPKY